METGGLGLVEWWSGAVVLDESGSMNGGGGVGRNVFIGFDLGLGISNGDSSVLDEERTLNVEI